MQSISSSTPHKVRTAAPQGIGAASSFSTFPFVSRVDAASKRPGGGEGGTELGELQQFEGAVWKSVHAPCFYTP